MSASYFRARSLRAPFRKAMFCACAASVFGLGCNGTSPPSGNDPQHLSSDGQKQTDPSRYKVNSDDDGDDDTDGDDSDDSDDSTDGDDDGTDEGTDGDGEGTDGDDDGTDGDDDGTDEGTDGEGTDGDDTDVSGSGSDEDGQDGKDDASDDGQDGDGETGDGSTPGDTDNPTDPSDTSRAVIGDVAGPMGSIVPLYIYPSNGAWQPLIEQKQKHPNLEIVAAVNPGNGPGTAKDTAYAAGISSLASAGIVPIGYVATDHGNRAAAEAKSDIDTWARLYPEVKGVFFDEQDNQAAHVGYYRDVGAYAKSKGLALTVGNPGTMWTDPGYFQALDVILIYEKDALPDPVEMEQKLSGVDRAQCGIIPYSVTTLDATKVQAASKWAKWVYVSEQNLPDPWKQLPSYLGSLFDTLDPAASQ